MQVLPSLLCAGAPEVKARRELENNLYYLCKVRRLPCSFLLKINLLMKQNSLKESSFLGKTESINSDRNLVFLSD